MVDFDVKEKVRQAREQAASKALGLKDAVGNKVGDARDLLVSGAADLRDAGAARIRETLEEFNAALPAIRAAGYTLTEVSVSIGIPPAIVASFHSSESATEEAANRILEENKDRKLVVFLVRALLQAWKLQTSIAIVGMKPRAICIELGLAPSVVVKFA